MSHCRGTRHLAGLDLFPISQKDAGLRSTAEQEGVPLPRVSQAFLFPQAMEDGGGGPAARGAEQGRRWPLHCPGQWPWPCSGDVASVPTACEEEHCPNEGAGFSTADRKATSGAGRSTRGHVTLKAELLTGSETHPDASELGKRKRGREMQCDAELAQSTEQSKRTLPHGLSREKHTLLSCSALFRILVCFLFMPQPDHVTPLSPGTCFPENFFRRILVNLYIHTAHRCSHFFQK